MNKNVSLININQQTLNGILLYYFSTLETTVLVIHKNKIIFAELKFSKFNKLMNRKSILTQKKFKTIRCATL